MKLPFKPETASYSVTEGLHRLSSEQLDSPAPDIGKGIARTAFEVSCEFVLEKAEFVAFTEFYEQHMFGMPFEADLILDSPEIKEYKCRFDYSTYQLKQRGDAYFINIIILAK